MPALPLLLLAALALPPAVHVWTPDGLAVVPTTPGRVTDIVLEPGEALAGTGPVAAGDTARWIIGQTESGQGGARQVHVLVKPTDTGLATNLLITTDRRTYRLELRSTSAAWSPSVTWRYPAGDLIALRATARAEPPPHPRGPPPPPPFDPASLNFGWRIEGRAAFRPHRVFDDGRRTFLDFPPDVTRGAMPPLFVAGEHGGLEPAVTTVSGTRMTVDRLFARGELRLGKRARVVLIRETLP